MKKTKRQAIIYARFSPRPNAKECDSVEKQLQRIRAWCMATGFEVAGEYSDENQSGKEAENRLGLQAALKHVCRIRGIFAVYDISRLTRKAIDGLLIAEKLRRKKVELMSVVDRIDTTTPNGRLLFGIQLSIAQNYREVAAERTSSAMVYHQYKNQRRMGRIDRCPFGYRPVVGAGSEIKREIEADEIEQAIIVKMIAYRNNGSSYREIGRLLDARGDLCRGNSWDGKQSLIRSVIERHSASSCAAAAD
jgi:DNA invertase Pin-like site-specific DNA recombinase